MVAPDDTPPPVKDLIRCRYCGLAWQVCADLPPTQACCPDCNHVKRAPVAPDDTPTRLLDTIADELHDRWVGGENPDVTYPDFLVAEVSRLREELQRKDDQLIGSQRVKEDYKHLTEELRKSQEENALLRRSLEMLTKQMDEKDSEIVELKDAVYRLCPPRS